MRESAAALEPGLHLVATPIGNAADITLRALQTLRAADMIACEDKRVSSKLFSIHGITAPRLAYHDHNAERMRPQLIARLREGQRVALVSDAGTPLISDPGYKLVQAALAENLPVHVAPGASASLAALLLSGLPSNRFMFVGFLSARPTPRRRELAALVWIPATLVFFEAAQRLAGSLADMATAFGNRPAAVARELTKLHEEVVRAPLEELAARYAAEGPPRGEVVVVVGAPLPASEEDVNFDQWLRTALKTKGVREAAAEVAVALGLPRRTVYARALELSRTE